VQLGAALVDVADEVLVDTVGEFEVADQALALGLGLGDRPAQGAYPVGAENLCRPLSTER
jgi:hypothetical protein